jgi:OOP family OmpA-OmpF porin
LAQDSGWLIGASLGPTQTRIDDARIGRELLGQGLVVNGISDSDRDNGYKFFGGYQMNKNFAIEGGYFELGKFGFAAITLPPGTLDGRIKLRGLNLDLVGTLSLSQKWALLGRIGANYAEAQDTFVGAGAVTVLNPNPNKYDTNVKVGLGLQYALTDSLLVRTELERYRIDDAVGNRGDVDHWTVGLVYRFGMKPAPAPVWVAPPAPTPAPVAYVPAPVAVAPVVAPAPVPAPMRVLHQVSMSVDSDFAFDKSSLSASGTQVLEKFLVDLRGMNYQSIAVRGNADRIGSEAYNMKLSVRRAEAVQTYLVTTGGIAADKLVTSGVGESEPMTTPSDCDDAKSSKTLIKCLAPDRRVDIEVTGTR